MANKFAREGESVAEMYINDIIELAKHNYRWQIKQILESIYLRGSIDGMEHVFDIDNRRR